MPTKKRKKEDLHRAGKAQNPVKQKLLLQIRQKLVRYIML